MTWLRTKTCPHYGSHCSCRYRRGILSTLGCGGPVLALVVLLLAAACAGSLPEARSQGAVARAKLGGGTVAAVRENAERCSALSDRHALYGGAGKSLALLGGSAGLGTIATADEELRTGLAIGSAVAAAAAAGAVFVSESAAESFVRECQ